MEASKVILSEAEHRLITDAQIILTKNSAIEKIVTLFGELAESYRGICSSLNDSYPEHFGLHPKISKGEKHQDLPWVILDYPRTFSKHQGHFAIRTFFWWGNYFSIHLQVSGIFLKPALLEIANEKLPAGWMTSLTNDPWDLNFPNKSWNELVAGAMPGDECYLLMAKKIPISQWEFLLDIFSEDYSVLALIMKQILGSKPVE